MGGQKLLCDFYLDKASHSGMNVPHEHCGPSHSGCGKHKSNGNGRPLEVFHYLESYSFWWGMYNICTATGTMLPNCSESEKLKFMFG